MSFDNNFSEAISLFPFNEDSEMDADSPSEQSMETPQIAKQNNVTNQAESSVTKAEAPEQNPSSSADRTQEQKRLQERLLRRVKKVVDQYTSKAGRQAVVLISNGRTRFTVYGSEPLKFVVKKKKKTMLGDLRKLLHQMPSDSNANLFKLPNLIADGGPISLDDMTQAQLRSFIPLMMKYSTGRNKPRWGVKSMAPPWWPEEMPFANVRTDPRTKEEKGKITFTEILRKVVRNCYAYHGREDLLVPPNKSDKMLLSDSDDDIDDIDDSGDEVDNESNYPTKSSTPKKYLNLIKLEPETIRLQQSMPLIQDICSQSTPLLVQVPNSNNGIHQILTPKNDALQTHHHP